MKISVEKREIQGKKVKNLRTNEKIPASVYGPKRSPINIQVDKKEFLKLLVITDFSILKFQERVHLKF